MLYSTLLSQASRTYLKKKKIKKNKKKVFIELGMKFKQTLSGIRMTEKRVLGENININY